MPGLSGMKEICSYVSRSEPTVMDWIQFLDFPAKRILGGIWESDTTLVDEWRRDQILNGPDEMPTKKPNKRTVKKKAKRK